MAYIKQGRKREQEELKAEEKCNKAIKSQPSQLDNKRRAREYK